jgi:hypothetical protein
MAAQTLSGTSCSAMVRVVEVVEAVPPYAMVTIPQGI